MHAKSLQPCQTLCNPMDCSPPGFSVHGILQARILEWVAVPSSRETSQPRDRTHISCGSCTAGGFFTTEPLGKPDSFWHWTKMAVPYFHQSLDMAHLEDIWTWVKHSQQLRQALKGPKADGCLRIALPPVETVSPFEGTSDQCISVTITKTLTENQLEMC